MSKYIDAEKFYKKGGITMTRKDIKNRVIEIVSNKIGINQNEICESTRFKEDLGTDSLDDVELLMEFERAFTIVIPDEEMFRIVNVGDVIDRLCKMLGVTNTIKSIDMNAPDKIYVPQHNIEAENIQELDELIVAGSTEYIRKDALMEWAKEQQRKWEECINTSKKFPELKKSLATYSGAKIQTEELIDKLILM